MCTIFIKIFLKCVIIFWGPCFLSKLQYGNNRDFMVRSIPACIQGSMKNKPEAGPISCAISL